MPGAPILRQRLAEKGLREIGQQLDAQKPPASDRDQGVSGEIGIDLKGKVDRRQRKIQCPVAGRVCIDAVDQRRQVVGDDDLEE